MFITEKWWTDELFYYRLDKFGNFSENGSENWNNFNKILEISSNIWVISLFTAFSVKFQRESEIFSANLGRIPKTTPRRCSNLHLRTWCRHLLYFLFQQIHKKPIFSLTYRVLSVEFSLKNVCLLDFPFIFSVFLASKNTIYDFSLMTILEILQT